MVFSSNIFLLYFLPAFLLLYFVTPNKFRNYTLLLASLIFYSYGAPDFIIQLTASTVVNFFLVKLMCKLEKPSLKKLVCGISIMVSLGLLAYYKYGNFTMENINAIRGMFGSGPVEWIKILLPVGISFFTFQSITYTVDTYRGVNQPMKKLSNYMVYIMMFPQLIAGPIVRYNEIAEQIEWREHKWSECLQGFYRFVIGLSKKILVADVLGRWVDSMLVAENMATLDTATSWIVIMAYTMQLYFDFSGYSDMAIGLGRIMGFSFPENFDNPYNSASISEFWRRWHITLGSFMRNYLYIPLGGNRCSKLRMYFNLWVVFLLSGLWHGASWNFVIWGAYHGFFLVMERLFLGKVYKRIGKIPSVLITFILVMVGWAIFRIESISECQTFITRLFSFDFTSIMPINNPQFVTTLIVALVFSFITLFGFGKKIHDFVFRTEYSGWQHILVWIVAMFLLLMSIAALNVSSFSPFIYFRF